MKYKLKLGMEKSAASRRLPFGVTETGTVLATGDRRELD